ncbi:hypothetical protein PILCRDRAFT_830381 [Piloderma croceum F 1598]|uniref:Secreted protein n=1 Tax=Piloderma croceum (strain F 1598) TaxID=765440 RepID=A0A0C3ETG4_PILCF|nr:hypothetical protein PILCRDRAFT_830381 [Piloderma croceum F 1598]
MTILVLSALLSVITVLSVVATPAEPHTLEQRLGVNGPHDFCMLMPSSAHTTIVDSLQRYDKSDCTCFIVYNLLMSELGTWSRFNPAGTKLQAQMLMPSNFWSHVSFKSGSTVGKHFAQLTGCIRPNTLDHLVPSNLGGQYYYNHPGESICLGYKHYIEIVEPASRRACIKCCNDPTDCQPSSKVHPHCPTIIPGKYFNCA